MNTNMLDTPSAIETSGSTIPIVFCCNDAFAPYAGVAIQSIIMNADPRNTYQIYVLHTAISEKHIEMLEGMSRGNISVRCLNLSQMISEFETPLPVEKDYSEEAYYRILIPEIEELKACSRVVYLDCDIVVEKDIAAIIPQDMGDNLLAAVRDYPMRVEQHRKRLERDYQLDAAKYVNSGVLVINVPQWIQEGTIRNCFDSLRKCVSAQKYVFMDQDILNDVCRDRILYLDDSWNYQWYMRFGDSETVELCRAVVERVGDNFNVMHFTTPKKPWNTPDHPYAQYFWKYAGPSPFMEEIIKTNYCTKAAFESEVPFIRVGRAVTWLPRKVSGGIHCVLDHGAAYTVRLALRRMGLRKDEGAGT